MSDDVDYDYDFDDDDKYIGSWLPPEEFEQMISEKASHDAKQRHRRYLKSDRWAKLRLAAMRAASYHCEECGAGGDLEVHHKTYSNLGRETLKDVVTLCRACHAKKH